MKSYKVKINIALQDIRYVDAENIEEAMKIAKEYYEEENYTDGSNIVGIEAREVQE